MIALADAADNRIVTNTWPNMTFWPSTSHAIDLSIQPAGPGHIVGHKSTVADVADGDRIVFRTDLTPGGLSPAVPYYVRDSTTSGFRLAATPDGPALDIAADGVCYFGRVLAVAAGETVWVGQVDLDGPPGGTYAPPPTWNTATMLGDDDLHPNDLGMTYLADQYEEALAARGKTPAPGTLLTAYGDSWTAQDETNTPGMRAVHQLRDRLGLTLVNNAVGASRSEGIAERAVGTSVGNFAPGTGGLVLVANAGLNDLVDLDTATRRAGSEAALRTLLAVLSAAQRIEDSTFTYSAGWSIGENPGTSAGTARFTSTNGATATVTVAQAGTYYLLSEGTNPATFRGGILTITQGATTVASVDVHGRSPLLAAGPLAIRLENVQAGTLTVTFTVAGRPAPTYGWADALVRISDTPPTILMVKPVEVLMPGYVKPALLEHIRSLYDSLAAEFGPHVVVCDPDPNWTL